MINLALIGVGKWGKNFINSIDKISGLQIKFILTKTDKNWISLPHGIKTYTKIDDLLRHCRELDCVIIATPPSTHFDISKTLITQGIKYLLVEKPLTINYDQAKALYSLCQEKRAKVFIDHIYLYNFAYIKFKKLLECIGPLKRIIFQGLGSPIREDTSILWDWGSHPLSIFLDLFKTKPKILKCIFFKKDLGLKKFDSVNIELNYSGIVAKAYLSWSAKSKKRFLKAIGEKGTITLDDTKANQKIILQIKNKQTKFPPYLHTPPLVNELNSLKQAIELDSRSLPSDLESGVEIVKELCEIERLSAVEI